MKKAAWHKTRGSIESTKTLSPLATILCKQYRNEKPTTLVVWRVGKESPARPSPTTPAAPTALPLLPEPRQATRSRAASTLRPTRPPSSPRKESPTGCACLPLLPQPARPSLIDERGTTQIGSPPVSTQFPFLYSNLRLEYSSSTHRVYLEPSATEQGYG